VTLYPIYQLADGMQEIPSGNRGTMSFTLEPESALVIRIAHLGPPYVQDHSLRAWVSLTDGGAGLTITQANYAAWHPNRTPDEIVYVVDEALREAAPLGPLQVLTRPGTLWLNILNLVNKPNPLSLQIESVTPNPVP